jgi:fatty acid synthase subunit alpha, fungi type
MKSIFPSAIDGDFLKLVHLSNGFRMVSAAKPFQAGDVCRAEARIISVTNANKGKIVKVKGYVCHEGTKVVEVISFLYRGRFLDFENTFERSKSLITSCLSPPMQMLEFYNLKNGFIGTILLASLCRLACP